MRSMLPDREIRVRTLRIPTAHGSIPALLPDGFSSLWPVLRINAELRGTAAWLEFVTAAEYGGRRG